MKGANGFGYTFRKLEKHPERVLPQAWQDSELRAIAVDQTAAALPAATVIVGAPAQAVGIPFYGSRLAIMPDDPVLVEFRQTFAKGSLQVVTEVQDERACRYEADPQQYAVHQGPRSTGPGNRVWVTTRLRRLSPCMVVSLM